jgi:uncharacterized membrane protein YgaE (UPF0421/DUF939 family)
MAERDEQDVRGEEDPEFTEALGEALGDEPRAHELRDMKRVLSERRARLSNDFDHADDDQERESLRRELKKLDEQIAILAEEAEITKFVEDAVRVGIEMRRWGS